MKIVCLTENSPGLRYTVNAINRRHGVALVVFEQSKRAMFFRDMKRYGVRDTLYRTRMVAKRLLPGRSDKSRSEEHTSELQSLMRNPYAVFCLKKKTNSLKKKNTTSKKTD